MAGPSAAQDALEALARGGLRGPPREAWELVERAWPELERWVGVFLRAAGAVGEIREDCGQEVLLRVWRTRSGYRGESRGELLAWISRICGREHHRAIEKRARGPRPHADHEHETEDERSGARDARADDPTVETAEERESLRALSDCLRELPDAERETVELLYAAEALTEREVALVIEASKSQVNVLRRRALARLAACLRRKGVDA